PRLSEPVVEIRHAELGLVTEKRVGRPWPLVQRFEMSVEARDRCAPATECGKQPRGIERHRPAILGGVALREAFAAERIEALLEGTRGISGFEVPGLAVHEVPPGAGAPQERAGDLALTLGGRETRDREVGRGILERRRRRTPDGFAAAERRARGAVAALRPVVGDPAEAEVVGEARA